ncbi:MAG TPA: DnaJ domain-containing protein [Spirochaetota bacterium]|nr:DnaJ domain-containing protein [Spirochaetota bacterium]
MLYKQKPSRCRRCHAVDFKPVYDYYRLFELPRSFTEQQLRSAYKKLSLKYHPDINKEGENIFIVISRGYQILKSRESLAEYDRIYDKLQSGVTAENAYEQTYQENPFTQDRYSYYTRNFTREDFENIFKEFHNFRRADIDLMRMSRASGSLASIIGLLFGLFFFNFSIFSSLFFAGIGYLFGRISPGLGLLFYRVANIAVIVFCSYYGFLFFQTGHFFWLFIIALGAFSFFSRLPRWRSELGLTHS